MRATFLTIALLTLAVAGCGSDDPAPRPRDAADINRANHAAEAVYLQRVLGDDPVSESVSLRVNGTATVRRGGGRGYWDVAVELAPDEAERALALVRRAPFKRLAGNTITPGGFGGDDDGVRYMMRRGKQSITVADADVPRSMRTLVDKLNGLIDGDVGRIVADDRHFSVSGVTGAASSDVGDSAPHIENSPATPLAAAGAAPAAQRSLSCYGEGGRQAATDSRPAGIGAGPLVFAGLRESSRGRVIEAPIVLQPGGAATVSVAARDRDRAGLLYASAWRGPHRLAAAYHTLRFEGCSDSTAGGGPARFDGGLVVTGKRCATLLLYTAAGSEPVRRRVACGS
jgi:hypothetical protein